MVAEEVSAVEVSGKMDPGGGCTGILFEAMGDFYSDQFISTFEADLALKDTFTWAQDG